MREVIACRFTPAELAAIANAFEKDTERLTRGVRNGRRPPPARSTPRPSCRTR